METTLQNIRFNLPNIRTLSSVEDISEGRQRSIFVVGRFQRTVDKIIYVLVMKTNMEVNAYRGVNTQV